MSRLPWAIVTAVLAMVLALAGCGGDRAAPARAPERSVDTRARVVFLGDSLTAGYGIDEELAYPALIQKKLDSAGLPFVAINAGISGDTSAGGLQRLDWTLSAGASMLVVALGTNDGMRGIDPASTRGNLAAILKLGRSAGARVVLAGMLLPPNYGPDFTSQFRGLYPALAAEQKVDFIPLLLEGVGGVLRLNQADGIHPTTEGHRIMAETVWKAIAPILRESGGRAALPVSP